MGALTKEILEERRGVCVGFFYLKVKKAFTSIKCQVFVKAGVIHVWDGATWRRYDEFESEHVVNDAIQSCQEFNGRL